MSGYLTIAKLGMWGENTEKEERVGEGT